MNWEEAPNLLLGWLNTVSWTQYIHKEFLGVEGALRKRVFTLLGAGMLPRLCGHKDVQRLCALGSGSVRKVDTFRR